MASKEKQTIVVDHVHSKRESPEEQSSETKGRQSLVTVVATIGSIAVLIAVVFVRKHLM